MASRLPPNKPRVVRDQGLNASVSSSSRRFLSGSERKLQDPRADPERRKIEGKEGYSCGPDGWLVYVATDQDSDDRSAI